jgi:hypothetical protein
MFGGLHGQAVNELVGGGCCAVRRCAAVVAQSLLAYVPVMWKGSLALEQSIRLNTPVRLALRFGQLLRSEVRQVSVAAGVPAISDDVFS